MKYTLRESILQTSLEALISTASDFEDKYEGITGLAEFIKDLNVVIEEAMPLLRHWKLCEEEGKNPTD